MYVWLTVNPYCTCTWFYQLEAMTKKDWIRLLIASANGSVGLLGTFRFCFFPLLLSVAAGFSTPEQGKPTKKKKKIRHKITAALHLLWTAGMQSRCNTFHN